MMQRILINFYLPQRHHHIAYIAVHVQSDWVKKAEAREGEQIDYGFTWHIVPF
jgi:hypothetical protein